MLFTVAEFIFRLEKREHFFYSVFLNPNLTKNRVGLTSRLENYLSEIKNKLVHLISIFQSTGTVNRRAIQHSRSKYKIFLHYHLPKYTLQQQQTTAKDSGRPAHWAARDDHVIAWLVLLAERLPCCLFTLLIKKWTQNWLENSLFLEIK